MSEKELRNKVIRLAHQNPELRDSLLPLLEEDSKKLHRLPDDPSRYFLKVKGFVVVPLSKVKPIRAREGGILRANKHMLLAYRGLSDKRKPISLRKEKNGTYTVLDGNSTFANAKASGWKTIWGVIEEDNSH